MQMSNCAFSLHANLTFTLPFAYLHMQVCTMTTVDWQALSFHLHEDVQYVRQDLLACLWPGTLADERLKASKGIKELSPPALLVEAHVALCKPSSSENKDRSYGSSCHKATVQGHWTRRQPPAPCLCVPQLKIISTSSSSVCLSIFALLLYHRSKADLSF